MSDTGSERGLEKILNDLIVLPLRSESLNQALKRLVVLCREALRSRACTLAWVDFEQRLLTQEASAGLDEEFEAFMAQHKIKIGSLHDGVSLYYDLSAGEVIKQYNLQKDGGGIANPEVAKRYELRSALCYPLKRDGRIVGYLNHFSSGKEPFTGYQESLLKMFAMQAESIARQSKVEISLKNTKNLIPDMLKLSPEEFLRQLPNRAHDILPYSVCVIWKLDAKQDKLSIIAASDSVDDEYRKKELAYKDCRSLLSTRKAKYLPNVGHAKKYNGAADAESRGWVSLLSIPMWVEDKLIGLLDVYTKYKHFFIESERELLEDFAATAALSIQKSDLQQKTNETLIQRQRLEAINYSMTAMADERDVGKILRLLLSNSLLLADTKWGWVRRFNASTGALEVTAKVGTTRDPIPLKYGEGITWKAIIERKHQLANDVLSEEWKKWYVQFSDDTRSELAIPLLIDKVAVREKTKPKLRSRAIGVLNLESPRVNAFSDTHIAYLLPLVRQAALLIDRLESEQKQNGLREVERKIIGKGNWREVLQAVVMGIKDTLSFDYVNVSLVDNEQRVIKSEYVVGIPDDEVDYFKRVAVYSLDGKSIQADIVRNKKIEVPEKNDPRFDIELYDHFQQESLIRVFIPMIASSNGEVIGTLEAGHQRAYRDYIYESDIQFLQSFAAYAIEAIEPSRIAFLEKTSHELRSSIVGIRYNADYVRLMAQVLTPEMVETKVNDILADSDILLHNVGELEYFLGRTSQRPRIEEILVIRDIVIKTANQLKPLIRAEGFDTRRMEYPRWEAGRIRIYVDRARLNQVVYNLLLNSIKYAENDPGKFAIRITFEETPDKFILKFADWGIGIKPGNEEKIFENGFRTQEAKDKNVSGSGLGLTIARERMREIGGELILANNYKPTEFHMLIPKSLTEAPE